MTTTIGYNECNNVAIANYQNYLQVDLSLVKNEPIDSIDYQQTSNQTAYHYVQHHQQISPHQLPPTPPSPNSSNDANSQLNNQLDSQLINQQVLNQNDQLNNHQTINQQFKNRQLINQQATSQINITKAGSQINTNQLNHNQINQHVNNPIVQAKNQSVYLPVVAHQNLSSKSQIIVQQQHQTSSNQQVASKYRKNKTALHNLKPYSLPIDHQLARNPIKTNSISRRNERERKRVKNVNEGFRKLRDHIPNNEKKMSKVETLRSAVKYIKQLEELLNGDGISSNSTDFLFNIIHQNASLQEAIKNESSNNSTLTNNQIDQQDQTSSSSLDYFDLAELLSQ